MNLPRFVYWENDYNGKKTLSAVNMNNIVGVYVTPEAIGYVVKFYSSNGKTMEYVLPRMPTKEEFLQILSAISSFPLIDLNTLVKEVLREKDGE